MMEKLWGCRQDLEKTADFVWVSTMLSVTRDGHRGQRWWRNWLAVVRTWKRQQTVSRRAQCCPLLDMATGGRDNGETVGLLSRPWEDSRVCLGERAWDKGSMTREIWMQKKKFPNKCRAGFLSLQNKEQSGGTQHQIAGQGSECRQYWVSVHALRLKINISFV